MIRRPPRSTRTDTLFPYTTLFRSLGETVGAGQAILRVADYDSPLVIRVPLAERDAEGIAIGTPAEVRFEGRQALPGRVAKSQPLVDGATGTRMVEVRLPSGGHGQSGAIASVR